MLGMGSTQPGWVKIKYKSELVELNQTQVKTHTLFFGLGLGKLCGPSPILPRLETRRIKRKSAPKKKKEKESAKPIKKMEKKKKKNFFGLVCATGFERQLD